MENYERIGRLCQKKELLKQFHREIGIGQFSFYRFGYWLEENYPEVFKELSNISIDWDTEISFDELQSMKDMVNYYSVNGSRRERRLAEKLAKTLNWIETYILNGKLLNSNKRRL